MTEYQDLAYVRSQGELSVGVCLFSKYLSLQNYENKILKKSRKIVIFLKSCDKKMPLLLSKGVGMTRLFVGKYYKE